MVKIEEVVERPWVTIEKSTARVALAGKIPKIIHQTWRDRNVPPKWQSSPAAWKHYHKDWLYVLWTDKDIFDYIRQRHPLYYDTFRKFPYGIQKADAIRYFILHDFGGLYSDLDLVPKRNVESYLADGMPVYLLFSPNMNVFTNFLMASAPGELLWREIWKRLSNPVMPSWVVGKHLEVMYSTGPAMVNDVVMNYPQPIGFLPRTVFAPMDVTGNFGTDVSKKAGVIMLPGQSWNSIDSTILNWFYARRYPLLVICVFLALFGAYVLTRRITRRVTLVQ
jgi:inositol phosphorylceramide mannosyltransferase catalytic subunit